MGSHKILLLSRATPIEREEQASEEPLFLQMNYDMNLKIFNKRKLLVLIFDYSRLLVLILFCV